MILDDGRLHELRSTPISFQARPGAEITARAHQLRRRRRVTSATVTTAAVALVFSAVTWGLPGLAPAPAPAAGPRFGAPPWPVPTAPYHALYEEVRVSFPGGPATCGKDHAVDLRDPSGGPPAAGDAVLTIRPGCTNPPTGAIVTITAPKSRMSSGPGQESIAPRVTADDCFYGMRNHAMAASETVLSSWPDDAPESRRLAAADVPPGTGGPVFVEVQNVTQCILVAPDPSRDLPLAMARVELVLRDDRGIDATFTAWRGGPPVHVRPWELHSFRK
jgi:hypothetical protein